MERKVYAKEMHITIVPLRKVLNLDKKGGIKSSIVWYTVKVLFPENFSVCEGFNNETEPKTKRV